MAFLCGKNPDNDNEPEEDTQPTLPLPAAVEAQWLSMLDEPTWPSLPVVQTAVLEAKKRAELRLCPLCLWLSESRGEQVEVGMALLRMCEEHQDAMVSADMPTRVVLHRLVKRAFDWYTWPPGTHDFD